MARYCTTDSTLAAAIRAALQQTGPHYLINAAPPAIAPSSEIPEREEEGADTALTNAGLLSVLLALTSDLVRSLARRHAENDVHRQPGRPASAKAFRNARQAA